MTPGSVFRINQEGYAANLPVFFSALSAEQITLKDDKGNALNAGSTMVSIIIDSDELFWSSVGDSRLYLLRKDEFIYPYSHYKSCGCWHREESSRRPKDKITGKYIIDNVEIPTSIVECGFLSNPEEEKLLQDDNYQKRLAWGIYTGIMDYFYNN